MKPLRVLVPTRGSAPALGACREAARMLAPGRAEVRLLTVLPEELYPNPYTLEGKQMSDMPERLERVRETAERALGEARRIFEEAGHPVEANHRFGNPPKEILNEIREWAPDLVVMGWWVARAPQKWVAGSIFERVIRHTEVPVLLMRYRE
ncbi:MAG: universal stress protein [Actinomycetota bacterium]